MYLRLVQVRAKPGEVSTIHAFYGASVIPALQSTPGCLYACLMQSSQHPEELVSMTMWETQDDAEAYEKGGLFENLMKQVQPLLAETSEWRVGLSKEMLLEYGPVPEEPRVSTYPVSLEIPTKQMNGSNPPLMYLRIVSVKLKPEMREEYRRLYLNEIIPVLQATKGCRHAYLVMPGKKNDESLSVTIWDSKEDAENYEKGGLFAELVNKVKHTFTDLVQWKMKLDKTQQGRAASTEDLRAEGYSIVAMKSFQ